MRPENAPNISFNTYLMNTWGSRHYWQTQYADIWHTIIHNISRKLWQYLGNARDHFAKFNHLIIWLFSNQQPQSVAVKAHSRTQPSAPLRYKTCKKTTWINLLLVTFWEAHHRSLVSRHLLVYANYQEQCTHTHTHTHTAADICLAAVVQVCLSVNERVRWADGMLAVASNVQAWQHTVHHGQICTAYSHTAIQPTDTDGQLSCSQITVHKYTVEHTAHYVLAVNDHMFNIQSMYNTCICIYRQLLLLACTCIQRRWTAYVNELVQRQQNAAAETVTKRKVHLGVLAVKIQRQ